MKKQNRRKFQRVLELECFPEVKKRLIDGFTTFTVAQWIHDRGEYQDVKVKSLSRVLARYRDQLLSDQPELVDAMYVDKVAGQQSMPTVMDELDEMAGLIYMQKARIGKNLKLEKSLPKLLKDLRPEIITLFDMLEKRAKLGRELKLPVGSMTAGLTTLGGMSLSTVLDQMSDGDRAKIRRVIQAGWLQVVDEHQEPDSIVEGSVSVPQQVSENE